MATLERALVIAAQAHSGQTDKEGLPYITHPLRVMQLVEGSETQIVALLHDVVEDTAITFDDLAHEGFSTAILEALRCVTHEPEVSYAEYVIRCKANPIARQVKLADLQDNTRLTRVLLRPTSIERDMTRTRRYLLSYKFLTEQLSEADYRQLMQGAE
jgi:(p)ppGpp synthase/HD superfamily hydrolase